jgi:hypothetical protein
VKRAGTSETRKTRVVVLITQRRQGTSEDYEVHEGQSAASRPQVVGIPIIRVAHVTDQKAVPLACPMRRSTEGNHGHSRTAPQASRPGLTHVGHLMEET